MFSIIGFFRDLFDTSDFPARWNCGRWSPGHGWLHIISDLAIFGAYFSIPALLAFFVVRRRDVPLPGIFWLFVAFIFACGTTHLCEAIIFWEPIYRVAGLAKLSTALVSWTTVFALAYYMPVALNFPTIMRRHDELAVEVERRTREQAELARARDLLEVRTSHSTLRDRRINDAMQAANACAVCWEVDSGRIVWSLGTQRWLALLGSTPRDFETWDAILGPAEVERLREASRRACEEEKGLDLALALFDAAGTERGSVRIAGRPEARATGEPATMIGMFRVVLPQSAG